MTMNDLENGILVVDFGSQTTLLIARRVRELGVYCEVWPCTDPRLSEAPQCLGVILSGGPASVGTHGAPTLPEGLFRFDRPVLGICYGMQLYVEHLGGQVDAAPTREFGRTPVTLVDEQEGVLADLPRSGSVVWMSHNDAAVALPSGGRVTARTEGGVTAAVEVADDEFHGLQFHPEVSHTELGEKILGRFAKDVCGAAGEWTMAGLAEQKVAEIREQVGDARVICGLSGGVDSSVAAALISRAIGKNLVCILVDNGLMRHAECEEVEQAFNEHFEVELRSVDASRQFLDALSGLSDPEQKRKAIGKTFIDVFEQEAKTIPGVGFLAQGTLYPDVIESVSVAGGPSAVIKSHHNVGGLPERLPFELVEPLRMLFKDEVRALGAVLGLPAHILGRHPFPGPGLGIRIIGDVTEEKLALVREADRIFMDMLRQEKLYDRAWQAFCVLLPVRTVGVMGDARTYERVLALRAVTSLDGMTADRAELPIAFLGRVADRIVNNVTGINRVVYDLTSKPPGTIEWE